MGTLEPPPAPDDPPSGVDLDDTACCLRGWRCEACGDNDPQVTVYTVTTALGTLCLTMCLRCALSGVEPPLAISTVTRLVAQHAIHVTGGYR